MPIAEIEDGGYTPITHRQEAIPMKKLIGYGTAAAILVVCVLMSRNQNAPQMLSSAEKQSLRDAPNETERKSGPLFAPHMRFLLGASGAVLVDEEIYDVGPQPGETAFWNGLGIRLKNASADALSRRQEGGRYEDQYGGVWTVRRLEISAYERNKKASCDPVPEGSFDPLYEKKVRCYFLVPEFGGYASDKSENIVGVVTKHERDAIFKKTHDDAEASLAKMTAEGFLTPPEMIRTPMFVRLKEAMVPFVDADAVKNGALRPQDFPHFKIEGRAGAWKVVFFNDADGRPVAMLGTVSGSSLAAAHFGLSEEYHSIIDTGHSGIKYIDTIGLDPFVVSRAFQEAYATARESYLAGLATQRGLKTEGLMEKVRKALDR